MTLKDGYNDKYEYIYPELTFDKNLFNNSILGSVNYNNNLKIHTYDTNKTSKTFVNNFDWSSITKKLNSGIQTSLIGNLKNINYEKKNISKFKTDTTSELFGSLGLLNKIDLYKKIGNFSGIFFHKSFVTYSRENERRLY